MRYLTLSALPWLSAYLVSGAATPQSINAVCKPIPGGAHWPDYNAWMQLTKDLDGRLIIPTAPGGVCHSGYGTYSAPQCALVAQEWTSYTWIANNPVAVSLDQNSNDTCLPVKTAPCSDGGYPRYVVNATTPEHVKTAIDFARKYNVRLNIKNTGHDFLGRSNAPGSLSIWTHHFKNFTYYPNEYKLASGKTLKGNAVKVGAGSQLIDIATALGEHKQTIVSGIAETVGVGGYTSGGGHSLLSPTYGLSADNVLEVEMVTPGGEIITANEDQNEDLFWAVRGGGGGTFGVLTSITYKTHPSPKVLATTLVAATDARAPFVLDLLTFLASQAPTLMDGGFSAYAQLTNNMTNPLKLPGYPTQIAGFLAQGVMLDATADDLAKLVKPLNETLEKKWPGEVVVIANTTSYDSWLDFFKANFDGEPAGGSVWLASRLLDRKTLTESPDKFSSALEEVLKLNNLLTVFLLAGKGVNHAQPAGGSNAVNPAWRSAYIHSYLTNPFADLNNTAATDAANEINKALQPLRDLTPDSGSYLNEAFRYEADFQKAFWGGNYERLLSIKRKVDPGDVLWCDPCVGNERWEQKSNGQLCRRIGY